MAFTPKAWSDERGATNNLVDAAAMVDLEERLSDYADTRVLVNGVASALTLLTGTVVWDPDSVVDGAVTSTTLAVAGAAIGDPVVASFTVAVPAGALLVGAVTAEDTVTVTLFNKTGSALNLGSGTLRADVRKP